MINKNIKWYILGGFIIIAICLVVNRFQFPYITLIDKSNTNELFGFRHLLEHFTWALIIPLIFMYAPLVDGKLAKNKGTAYLLYPYCIGLAVIVVVQICRILLLHFNYVELLRSIYEICGAVLGYYFYAKPILCKK